jgi:Bacterial Alpha-2-macroglobulin MG10 domain
LVGYRNFALFNANTITEKILTDNPKIKTLLEFWKNNPTSKLKMNQELKSILLSETPWLVNNSAELERRMTALLDLNTIKTTNQVLLNKLIEKQSSNGGFSWFGNGFENTYISQHILSGMGHLIKIDPKTEEKFNPIISKSIGYLDNSLVANHKNSNSYTDLHALYARSYFLESFKLNKKIDSIAQLKIINLKQNWLEKSLYQKTVLALVSYRFGEKTFAKTIVEHLRQSTILDDTKGMFWKENTNGYYWYQNNIEVQALLIEAFAEIDPKTKEIEAMKVWLINHKQNKNWHTTKASALAINAILSYGKDWVNAEPKIIINKGENKEIQKTLNTKIKESEIGLLNIEINKEQINKITAITLENKGVAPVYGGIYYQYFEDLDKIENSDSKSYSITKEILLKDKLANLNDLKIGDLLTIRLTIKTEKDLEFVHIKDLRASCFEPVNVISERKWENNMSYYMQTKDVASHFFFDQLSKGAYILEYQVRVNNQGVFSNGMANLQSMYAPEFSAHSNSGKVTVNK